MLKIIEKRENIMNQLRKEHKESIINRLRLDFLQGVRAKEEEKENLELLLMVYQQIQSEDVDWLNLYANV